MLLFILTPRHSKIIHWSKIYSPSNYPTVFDSKILYPSRLVKKGCY